MRNLRVLLAANDGFSAGHVARAVAIAQGIHRVAADEKVGVELLLLTTSEATQLCSDAPLAVVRLPSPTNAQRAGISDADRRRLVRSVVDTTADTFLPDVIVVDTFPRGPHGELDGLTRAPAKKALVRRHVRTERAEDDLLHLGIERFDLVLLADDPDAIEPPRGARRCLRVPPITMGEHALALSRAAARRELRIPQGIRAILVVAGGGGDAAGNEVARAIACRVAELEPHSHVVIAEGPLSRRIAGDLPEAVRSVSVAPLQRYLAAFDHAFSGAGYNAAHELAKAGVPTALFTEPRPFDDQRARAERFARAGLACLVDGVDDGAIRDALRSKRSAEWYAVPPGGADRAGEAVLQLVTGEKT